MAERLVRFRGTRADLYRRIDQMRRDLSEGRLVSSGGSSLLVRIGLAVLQKAHEQFKLKVKGGTDDGGVRWPPLSRYTLQKRRRVHAASPRTSPDDILVETGLTERSLQPGEQPQFAGQNPPYVAYQVFRLEGDAVIIGTSRQHALDHHEGRQRGKWRLPQRRLWPLSRDWSPSWWRPIVKQAAEGGADWLERELSK